MPIYFYHTKEKDMKKFLSRLKSTKGINGVIVALLLILVGVGAVAGIKTFMDTQKDTIQTNVEGQIGTMTGSTTTTTTTP